MKKIHISDLAKIEEVRTNWLFNDFSLEELQDVDAMNVFLRDSIYDEAEYVGNGYFLVV